RKRPGVCLLSIGRLNAQALSAAIRTSHEKTVAVNSNNFTHLPTDAFRIVGRIRSRLKHLQLGPVQRGPRAGGRIAPSNQVVDLTPGFGPIDVGILSRTPAFVARLS